jgi:hypothetical protein
MDDLYEEVLDNQLQAQETLLDLYKKRLETEQEELQNSLDERKKLYEKYFDALDEESSDEDFEDKQAKLQRAIASLASASDASSLAKMKELQSELEDLENDQLATERERRRENVMATLDNETEMVDDYYEKLLEDNRRLWLDIQKMNSTEIENLMTIYNEEWLKGTDLQRQAINKEHAELYDEIVQLVGVEINGIKKSYEEAVVI